MYSQYIRPIVLSQEEITLCSKIRLLSIQYLNIFLERVFLEPLKKSISIYENKEWLIFLGGFQGINICEQIPPGGWINKKTNKIGFDIISFYAEYRKIEYLNAAKALDEFFEYYLMTATKKQKLQWVQEKAPLIHQDLPFNSECYNSNCVDKYQYKNKSGNIIAHVIRYKSHERPSSVPPIPIVDTFYTLWKNIQNSGFHCYWIEAFPQPPYIVYNADLINNHKNAKIIFVESIENAYRLQNNLPQINFYIDEHGRKMSLIEKIYSTCPGGLKNLLHADLAFLSGRKIIIRNNELPISQVFLLRDIIDKMNKYNIFDIDIATKDQTRANMTYDPNCGYRLEPYTIFLENHREILKYWAKNENIINSYPCEETKKKSKSKTIDKPEEKKVGEGKTPRIPKKIKNMAKVTFLRNKNFTYAKIEKDHGIKHATANNIVKKLIPSLSEKEKQLFDIELNRLSNIDISTKTSKDECYVGYTESTPDFSMNNNERNIELEVSVAAECLDKKNSHADLNGICGIARRYA